MTILGTHEVLIFGDITFDNLEKYVYNIQKKSESSLNI